MNAAAALSGCAAVEPEKLSGAFYPGTSHGFNNDSTPRYGKKGGEIVMEPIDGFLQISAVKPENLV